LSAPQAILGRNLEKGLFTALSSDRQIEICITLLQIGVQDSSAVRFTHDLMSDNSSLTLGGKQLYSKRVLGNIVCGAPLIQHLLMRLQPTINQAVGPAKKRAKLDE